MLVSGVLLLLSDLRYHLATLRARPRLLAAALATLALAAAQYVRFRLLYPDALDEHLRVMGSVWTRDVPLGDKLGIFAQNYLRGLSPTYWFSADNGIDLKRHTFKGWGNFPLAFLPALLLGVWICLRNWHSSAHRAVLIAILAAPFSAALASIHNYRVLAMVVPAAIVICLGIDRLAGWLARLVPAKALAIGCAGWLMTTNLIMLRVALVDGPTWYNDYGLYGMQYGAMQVFPAIAEQLRAEQQTEIVVSPDWANNADAFVPFFLPEEQRSRVTFDSPKEYLTWKRDLKPSTIFVLPASDYELVRTSSKLVVDAPVRVLSYPDGRPGFYFVHIYYVDTIDAILAAEQAERARLIDDSVTIDGQTVQVRHSLTDLGSIGDLFDDDHHTLLRGYEANPLVLEFDFPEPRMLSGIGLDFWRVDLQLTVTVTRYDGDQPQTYTARYRGMPENPHVEFALPDGPIRARALRIELLDMNAVHEAKIHVPGLWLR
jgi:hypothetical protein